MAKLIAHAKAPELPVEKAYDESAWIPDNDNDPETQAPTHDSKPLEGDEVTSAEDIPVTKIGGMRFVPIRVAALVLERSSKATGLSATDIINVSLVLFQNASREDLQNAIASLNADKAEALFNSLK